MTGDINFPEDQSAVAWARFLMQHEDKIRTEAFVRSFFIGLTQLTEQAQLLLTQRSLGTAVGQQLDGIGSIVVLDRRIDEAIYIPFFGFASQPAGRGFGQARIRHNGEKYANAFTLPDLEYKMLLAAKIMLNISCGTVNQLIAAVRLIFNTQNVTLTENGNASITIAVNNASATRLALKDKIIPMIGRAAGVKMTIVFS